MNWSAFGAMLARDVVVARRNAVTLAFQTLLQPLLFVFVFGRVLIQSGFMTSSFKSVLLPGIIATAMLMTGVQAVSLPLLMELQYTKEIEDRLLAPMNIEWVGIEKVVAGLLQALIAGMVVIPAAWLLLGRDIGLNFNHIGMFVIMAVLVALFAASLGFALGCSVGQTHIGLVFSLVLAPMIMFGCAYYPWSALASFPIVQKAVLINPLVYASEGLRATLVPQVSHISLWITIAMLLIIDISLIFFGLNRFFRKVVS